MTPSNKMLETYLVNTKKRITQSTELYECNPYMSTSWKCHYIGLHMHAHAMLQVQDMYGDA